MEHPTVMSVIFHCIREFFVCCESQKPLLHEDSDITVNIMAHTVEITHVHD